MTQVKNKEGERVPSIFTDFFRDDFFNGDFMNVPHTTWVPAANVKETSTEYFVELAVPGMIKDDFSVKVEDDTLIIEAKKEEEKNEENERFTRKEFRTSSFVRSFRLPKMVQTEKIDAKYDNGILKVVLPKMEEAKKLNAREIKVL